jgi:hypothetical protein
MIQPVGSHTAKFRWTFAAAELGERNPVRQETTQAAVPSATETKQLARSGNLMARTVLASSLLAIILVLLASILHRSSAQKSAVSQFWSPVFSNPEPVLIYLAKPRVYRPSAKVYQRYSNPPGEFNSEWERLSQPPPLQPSTKLTWGDMVEYTDSGLAAGDVYAALRMSAMLTRMGKQSQMRIGTSYSFTDLHNSPAIIVGAFNNPWTTQMSSNLHFVFMEESGKQMIREQGTSGRSWSAKFGRHGEVVEDFGVVTRLLSSKADKVVVATAGITAEGTQAAGELVSSSELLEEALRTFPSDWARKNMQIVMQTVVTDSIPGPPQVVATYTW